MVIYKKGDLFEAPEDILAHGCNCRNGYGSGVAGLMAKKFPKAKYYYHEKFEEEGWKLGDVQFVSVYGARYIANCATQDGYLPRGVVHADYGAITLAMTTVKLFAKENKLSIAMPKIGAGLAGGDWNVIKLMLEVVFDDYDVTVYEL
jgi:O-acetyl-ADP-ribose deacetylase (regulator of RNase III)